MLRKLRRGRDITQAALARKVGVSRGYISMIETGQAPCPSYLIPRLAGVLNVSRQELSHGMRIIEVEEPC